MIALPRSTMMLAVGLLVLAACGDDTPESRVPRGAVVPSASTDNTLPAGLTPLAAAQLDSGNVAFRLKQFGQAQAFYEHAARTVPDHPAPWYGIYMVAQAQGQAVLADSALAMVAQRSGGGELLQQGVSQQHGRGTAGYGASTSVSAGTPVSPAGGGSALPVAARHPVLGPRR